MAHGNYDLHPENTEIVTKSKVNRRSMTSKASQATLTSAITIVEKEFPTVKKNIRKWDARGALLGHPGPSPPFGKANYRKLIVFAWF